MGIKDILLLCGGLGLFLYGMKMMGDGLERAAGDKLRNILSRLTNNRFKGVLVGTGVTAVVQSSSATTVMVVGFVNAGLLTLKQAIGVIMGADIGTTITAQIIAIKLTDYASIFVIVGVIMLMFFKNRTIIRTGTIVAGFGILFLGMLLMSNAMEPLKTSEAFQNFMISFSDNPLLGMLAGVAVTCVIQSSSASIGILQALAFNGLVPFESAVYIVLGCNIGTCITAMLASLGTSRNARRAAVMHLTIKVVGMLIFMPIVMLLPITGIFESLSPGDVARQVANFHTAFNILNITILFPCAPLIIKLAKRLIKSRPDDDEIENEASLRHMSDAMLETPTAAVALLQEDIGVLSELVKKNVKYAMKSFLEKDDQRIEKVKRREKNINAVSHDITSYIVKLSAMDLSDADTAKVSSFFYAVSDLERIGDHAMNIIDLAEASIDQKAKFSENALSEVDDMQNKTLEQFDFCMEIFASGEEGKLPVAKTMEEEIDQMELMCRENHIRRLHAGTCTPRNGLLFVDLVNDLERIADHAYNVAKSIKIDHM